MKKKMLLPNDLLEPRIIKSLNIWLQFQVNIYIIKLDDIVNEYNNTYHGTIKLNPADVRSSTYIEFVVENNDKYPKFKVGNHVRISKYENIFAKGYTSKWSEEFFMIKKC